MPSNHISPTAEMDPVEAMLTDDDTPEQQVARQQMTERVKQGIQGIRLNPKKQTFRSWDTVTIRWLEDGVETTLDLPIRSLTPQENEEIADRHSIKEEDRPDVPQVWDEEHQGWVDNTLSHEYMDSLRMLSKALSSYRMERLLMSLNCELEAVDGDEIVWSPAWPSEKKEQFRDRALQALYAMEFQSPQLELIDGAISGLSIQSAQEDAARQSGESKPPSDSQDGSTRDGIIRGRRRSQRRTR